MQFSKSRSLYIPVASSEPDEVKATQEDCCHCGASVEVHRDSLHWPIKSVWFIQNALPMITSSLFTLATVAIVAFFYLNSLAVRICTHTCSETSSTITTQHGYFPPFSLATEAYLEELIYLDSGERGAKAWNTHPSPLLGFVAVTDPRRYNLSKGMPLQYFKNALHGNRSEELSQSSSSNTEPYPQVFATTMTHQLHCLRILRHSMAGHINGQRFQGDEIQGIHLMHCLGFLRWTSMCVADTTLLGAVSYWNHTANSTMYRYTGNGTAHQCRNWDTIAAFLEERQPDLTNVERVEP